MFLRSFFILALLCSTVFTYAQEAKDFMFGAAMDLAKTDYEGILKKAQFSAEGHYFLPVVSPRLRGLMFGRAMV